VDGGEFLMQFFRLGFYAKKTYEKSIEISTELSTAQHVG
jgi:hypothetical protein